jgi:hypothetical protein
MKLLGIVTQTDAYKHVAKGIVCRIVKVMLGIWI